VIGGELALEEPRRKVPEGPLAALRLVDGERAGVAECDLDEEGGVGRPR
jgi:hypothetical protein